MNESRMIRMQESPTSLNRSNRSLLSLEDILQRRESEIRGRRKNKVESYVMRGANFSESDVDVEDQGGDRTIIVKRIDLIFNETECQVINFTDITAYKRLK